MLAKIHTKKSQIRFVSMQKKNKINIGGANEVKINKEKFQEILS